MTSPIRHGDTPTQGPLAGVHVLDLCGESGLFTGRQLGELGADVVRVEPPEGGAERRRGPFLQDASGAERSLYHQHFNANKRGITLDPASQDDLRVLRDLISWADILLSTADGLSLDRFTSSDEECARLNPDLINVQLSPFHPDGPFADYRANDLVAVASSGLMYLNGFPEDPPLQPGAEQGYHMGALVSAAGALVALVGRERGRRHGGRVTVSMQEAAAMATLQTANANIYTWHQRIPRRVGNRPEGQPGSIFQCKDGRWISFVVPLGAPTLWRAYVEWMAEEGFRQEYAEPDWDDPVFRQAHSHVTRSVLERLCATYDRAHIFHEGQRRRMLVMPLNDARDLIEDEHLTQRRFLRHYRHEALDAELTDVGPPYRFSATPVDFRRRAPMLDEHRGEVVGALRPQSTTRAARGATHEGAPPLEGLRVADFFWLIAGPSTTRVLSDFGADVIKIESESRVDNIRTVGVQPVEPGSVNLNGVFNDCNTNKRSITLNLNHPKGIELAKEIVARSDIVTNNFTGDRMDRWGLGYEDLRKVKPDIIMLTMPVMGTTGPFRRYGSYGNGVIAYSGLTQNMGFADRPPTGIAPLYSDFSSPYVAVSALMAAVYHRERTGHGQFIELAQAEATINLLGTDIMEVAANGNLPPRIGNRSRSESPHGAYPCTGDDRWLAVAVRDHREWHVLAEVIGRPDLAADPTLDEVEGRRARESEIDAAITAWTQSQDSWEAMAILQARGVPAAVVEDLQDMVERDPWLASRHYTALGREGEPAAFTTHAQPIWLDGETPSLTRAPYMGEHNEEVYRGLLGLTDGDLAELASAGVIY